MEDTHFPEQLSNKITNMYGIYFMNTLSAFSFFALIRAHFKSLKIALGVDLICWLNIVIF